MEKAVGFAGGSVQPSAPPPTAPPSYEEAVGNVTYPPPQPNIPPYPVGPSTMPVPSCKCFCSVSYFYFSNFYFAQILYNRTALFNLFIYVKKINTYKYIVASFKFVFFGTKYMRNVCRIKSDS